jgi:orotate phosphoribosyltransferase-like protein
LNSGFKTKSEEIQWRRAKILELKSQGLDQREMSQVLHVSPATITFDLQYLRDKARENVRDYTSKQFPLQFKVSLVAIQNAMKQFWDISQNAQDNREKMQALEHYRQCHIDMLAMLRDGGYALERHIAEENNTMSPYISLHHRE